MKKKVAKKKARARKAAPKLLQAAVTLTDIPAIGAYWEGQGGVRVGENVGDDGKVNGYLVAASDQDGNLVEISGAYGSYGKTIGASSYRDGEANTALMLKAGSPVAKKIAAVKRDGHEFFLASQCQTNLIRANLPTKIKGIGWVVTSTEASSHGAWCQNFTNGDQLSNYKDNACRAFAVRVVPIAH